MRSSPKRVTSRPSYCAINRPKSGEKPQNICAKEPNITAAQHSLAILFRTYGNKKYAFFLRLLFQKPKTRRESKNDPHINNCAFMHFRHAIAHYNMSCMLSLTYNTLQDLSSFVEIFRVFILRCSAVRSMPISSAVLAIFPPNRLI